MEEKKAELFAEVARDAKQSKQFARNIVITSVTISVGISLSLLMFFTENHLSPMEQISYENYKKMQIETAIMFSHDTVYILSKEAYKKEALIEDQKRVESEKNLKIIEVESSDQIK